MKEKLIWLNNLRVISTIAVIVIHISFPITNHYGKTSEIIWNIGNLYNSISRFCVPIFFMISGALLLKQDYKLSYFLKKRFWRIIPPLIFWSLIYIFCDYFLVGEKSFTLIESIKLVIAKIFHISQFHLWFVYTLLGLYLFIYLFQF